MAKCKSADDDHNIYWAYAGIISIGTMSCAQDFWIKLNGTQNDGIWIATGDEFYCTNISFKQWYLNWVNRIDLGLARYHAFKKVIVVLSLLAVQNIMNCNYFERNIENSNTAQNERRIFFENTPAYLIVDDNNIITKIVVNSMYGLE